MLINCFSDFVILTLDSWNQYSVDYGEKQVFGRAVIFTRPNAEQPPCGEAALRQRLSVGQTAFSYPLSIASGIVSLCAGPRSLLE
jgi:hypothetical protein